MTGGVAAAGAGLSAAGRLLSGPAWVVPAWKPDVGGAGGAGSAGDAADVAGDGGVAGRSTTSTLNVAARSSSSAAWINSFPGRRPVARPCESIESSSSSKLVQVTFV